MSDRRRWGWKAVLLLLLGVSPALAAPPPARPADALWVAEAEGVLRVEEGSGEVVLEADAGEDVRAVAFDPARRVLWTFSPGWLRSFGEDGKERVAIPVSVPAGRSLLAVDPGDGSVALAAGRGLWRFTAAGTPLGTLPLDGRVRGLAFDAARRQLWVATLLSLRAHGSGMKPVAEAALPRDAGLAGLGVAAESGMVWAVGGGHLRKLGVDGRLLLDREIPGLVAVAGDAHGGAWAATARDLYHFGPGGRTIVRLQPFAGVGTIGALAVQPRDGSVWTANEVVLAKVDAAGRVVRRVSFEPPVRLRALALALAAGERKAPPRPMGRLLAKTLSSTQATLVGTVRLPNGQPAVGATVAVLGQNGLSATTDASGGFAITPVTASPDGGPIQVSASLSTAAGPLFTAVGVWATGGTVSDVGQIDLVYVCDAGFKALPTPAPNGTVKALAVFDDGSGPALYVGGAFTTVGGLTVNGVARWNGTSWSALGSGLSGGTGPEVDALAVHNDGGGARLYAAGKFTKSGTATVNYVAKWTGSSWTQVGTGLATQVYALASWNGSLYAGGAFTTVGSTSYNRLARWNGSAWSAVGGGVSGTVQALAAYDDGSGAALYVGGAFATAGSVTVNRIARWNGTSWSALGGGVAGGTPEVDALAVWNDGDGSALYAGGKFTTANGSAVAAKYVARWRGGAWSAVGTGLATQVLALAPFDDGTGPALYAGGAFTTIAGIPYGRLARWNGTSWDPIVEGVDSTVSTLAVVPSGTGAGLYLGGAFATASGTSAARIVRWWRPASCADTTPPFIAFTQPAWGATVGTPTPVLGFALADGGSGVDTSTLTIQANGGPLPIHCTFGPGWGQCTPDAPLPQAQVTLIAMVRDLAGNLADPGTATQFTIQDDVPPSVAITSPAPGAVVTSAYPVLQIHADDPNGSGVDPSSAAAQLDGAPAGVDCRFIGTEAQCVLASPLAAGPAQVALTVRDRAGNVSSPASVAFTAAPAPPPTTTLHGTVRAADGSAVAGATVTVNEDRRLFAATSADGGFSIPGAVAGPGVFLSLTATASPPPRVGFAAHLAPVAGGVTEVGTITLQSSCDLRFRTMPLQPADGALENRQSSGPYSLTGTAAVYDDGSGPALYLGGAFTHAGGHEVDGVAKWTGSGWQALGGGALGGLSTAVNALAVYDDGTGPALYAGGELTSIGGKLAANLARWDGHAWSEVGHGVSAAVTSMAVYDDGTGPALYLTGKFTSVQAATTWDGRNLAIPAGGFARWSGQGWTVLPAPSSDAYARLKVLDDGTGPALYALGLDGLFKWSPAAGSWTRLLGDADLQSYPNKTLADFTAFNNTLYVAGLRMGVLKRNGGAWQQVLSASASIASLGAVPAGGAPGLYAAGAFTTNGPVKLGRWNGTAWTQPLADGKVLFPVSGLGAGLVLYGGETASGYSNSTAEPALWNGTAWTPLTPAGDTTGDVTSAVAFDDGQGEALFFAGPATAGGVLLDGGIGRWDGTRVTAAGAGLEGGGSAVFVLDDGTGPALYAVAGTAGRIAKWNGSGWTTVGSPIGAEIRTLAVADLGAGPRLYAGGAGVFRWNGTFWTSIGGPASVLALAGYQGALYAGGGSFWTPGEILQRYDGGAWSAVSGAPTDTVEALEVWSGYLYVGGTFVKAGGRTHLGLAAFDGGSWLTSGGCGYLANRDFPATGTSPLFGGVHALKAFVAAGVSQLVIGGDYLSACDSDTGSTLVAHRLPYSYVNLGTGVDGPVYSLSTFHSGSGPEVVVGGGFVSAGGQPAGKLAVWTTLPSFGQCSPAGQPPVITLSTPADGAWTAAAQQAFSGSLDEPATLSIDGQAVAVAADLTFSSPPLPLSLGANVFTLAATDLEGLTRQMKVTVVRDPAPPSLALTAPAAGATVPTARPTLVAAYDDTGSGIVPETLAFTVNGSPLTASCVSDLTGARCTPAVDLPAGAVTLTATVADRAGNSASASVAFSVAPAASSTTTAAGMVARADGSPVAGARVTVLGKSGATATTGADGRFTIPGVDVFDGAPLSLVAQAAIAGSALVGTATVSPIPSGTTDAGTIVLRASCAPSFATGPFAGVGVSGGSPARVSAAVVFDDGHGPALYAGGIFTTAGGVPASNLARWDGHAWAAVGGGLDGPVRSLAVLDDGSGPALYAAGDFAGANAFPGSPYRPAVRVAKWNGTSWSALGSGLGGRVYALAAWNGALYAGGGVDVPYLERWDAAAGTWSAVGPAAPNGTVYALGVFNGSLYAGGLFSSIGGVQARRIARWDGSSWSPLGAGTSGGVYSLAVFDGALYAGGYFQNAGDLFQTVGGIARWTGSAWTYAGDTAGHAISAGGVAAEGPQGIEALAVYDDGSGPALYALGLINDTGLTGIARLRAGSWSALGTGVATLGLGGAALAVFDDGAGAALYAGGDFTVAGQLGVGGIGQWKGGVWSGLGPGLDGAISALAVYDDGTGPALFAGGAFTAGSGRTVSHAGRWSGSGWSPLGAGMDGTVSALAVSGAGPGALLYAAGDFTHAGGVPAARAARWDGRGWAPLGGGFDTSVRALATFGGALYAGGSFTTAGGASAAHVARWDGASWYPLGAGMDGAVLALASGSAGGSGPRLFAAGSFAHAGNVAAANVAAWDGASWLPLGSGLNGEVDSLAIYDDGSGPALYAGGAFTLSGGTGVSHLARWNGSAWTAVGGGASGTVTALAAFDDGSGPALYAGGAFTSAGGVAVNGFARWNGASWSPLGDGTPAGSGVANGAVLALQPFAEATGPALYLGGSFGLAGGRPAVSIARWARPFSCFAPDSTPPTLAFTAPAAGSTAGTATPQLAFAWSDGESGVDPASLLAQANGTALAVSCTANATTAQCAPQAPLPEGVVSLSATVADHAGNRSAPATLSLTIDTRAPALAFTQPAAGAYIGVSQPQIALAWSGIDPETLHLAGPVGLTCAAGTSDAVCQPVSPLAEGAVQLTATATGHDGSTASASLSFTVDTAAPALAVTAPAEGATVPASGLQIHLAWSDSGSGIAASSLALTDGGSPLAASCAPGAGGAVCTPVSPFVAGAHTVAATVADLSGRTATAAVHFTVPVVDPPPPSEPRITLTAPADGAITTAAAIALTGSVSQPAALTVNGVAVPLDGANGFSYNAPLAEGGNRFDLVATGAGNLTGTARLSVVRDSTPPVISILEPKPDAYHDPAAPLQLLVGDSGVGVDPATLSLTLNGSPLAADCTVCAPLVTCTPRGTFPGGALSLGASVSDRAGSSAAASPVRFTVQSGYDITPPAITLTSPAPGSVTSAAQVHLIGRVSEPATFTVDGAAVPLDGSFGFDDLVTLAAGVNAFTLIAADANGNASSLTFTITLDGDAPGPVDATRVTVGAPAADVSTVTGAAGSVSPVRPGWTVVVTDELTGAAATVPAGADGSFTAAVAARGGDTLAVAVRGTAGLQGPSRTFTVPGTPQLPADPATLAPALDPTVATDLCAATAFLYTGAAAVQTGASPGAIDCRRVAVLRGRVLDRAGAPLPAVRVSVLHHPELGSTLTRADGAWDLAANGGGTVIVQLARPGYLPAQRKVKAAWRAWATTPDVVLIPLDAEATAIDLTAATPVQVARGSAVSDADGDRRATLLFAQGTQATLAFPGGGTQAVQSLTVRATEYTVGAGGPRAMPGELPPTTGYTYAVELSADEAAAAGASEIRFDRPVLVYLENFLGFPAGTVVPVGTYDRSRAAWLAAGLDGRVVQVLSVTDGAANLDVDGTGQAAPATALAALGVTDAERRQLASLYAPGQSLWRVPVTHFTPYDYNWVVQPKLPGAGMPKEEKPKGGDQDKKDDPCLCSGSILETENQILGEVVGLAGTPFTLNYRSDRVPGRKIADTLDIPLSQEGQPNGLKRIELEVDVAGQHFAQSFSPAAGQSFRFGWDGKDAYGRAVQGRQEYSARVGYVYDGQYRNPQPGCSSCFGDPGAGPLPGNSRQEVTRWQTNKGTLGSWDSRSQLYLGGWSLSGHHAFDPVDKVLYYGDGRRRNAADAKVLKVMAGNATDTSSGDGGPADEAGVDSPVSVAVEPDGTLHVVANGSAQIRKVAPDGTITTEAGMPRLTDPTQDPGPRGDGGPARLARLWDPVSAAIGPDGLLYIADLRDERIVRIEADGTLTNVIGHSTLPPGGQPPLIVWEVPWTITQILFGPDGKLYVAAVSTIPQLGTLYRFDLTWGTGKLLMAGRMEAVGNQLYWNENWETQTVGSIFQYTQLTSIAFDSGGDLYFSVVGCPSVWHRNYDGTAKQLAGFFDGTACRSGYSGDGGVGTQAKLRWPRSLLAREDGSLLFVDSDNHAVRQISPGGDITTIAGIGTGGDNGPGRPPRQTELKIPAAVTESPDHELIIADAANNVVRGEEPVFGKSQSGSIVQSEQIRVTSDDGAAVFVFDAGGRHLWTEDARTGVKLLAFAYDDHSRLITITDAFSNVTTLERDASGRATAIVGPFGQRTALTFDTNGFLASVTNPANEVVDFTYTADGLLQTMKDPKRRTYQYSFDPLGRLEKDEDPLHGFTSLARTDNASGSTVTKSTAMGRTTTYRTESLRAGGTKTTITAPDGTVSASVIGIDGTRTETSADGTVATSLREPDARFGMQSPAETSVSVRTPAGLTSTTTSARAVLLVNPAGDPQDPLNLRSITETATVNGRTMTSVRDFQQNRLTVTTPGGRQSVTQFDSLGRVSESRPPGRLPIATTYDARGRVSTVTQGDRGATSTYDAQGYVQSVADALGQPVSFTYDSVGRVKTETLPDNRVVQFDYDANGNLISITPPARPAHGLDHNEVDLGTRYTPPDVSAGTNVTTASYNLDRQLERILRPDGQTIQYTYDPTSGRLDAVTVPQGTYHYGYQPGTGYLGSVSDPDGGSLAFAYDGSLLTGVTWAGEVSGAIGLTYNNNFELTRRTINGGNPVDFAYDGEGLLQQAGALVLNRSAQTGLLTGTTVGSATDSYAYNDFGEVQSYTARHGGSDLFTESFSRDRRGRITQKVETIGGATATYNYTYDAAGRLTEVKKDTVLFEHYDYDGNSNRTSWTDPVSSGTATYDGQDRLLTYGGNTYTYSANGELATKTSNGQTIQYTYDVAGNLRTVLSPDGLRIDYVIDAANRRVGKKVNGVLGKGYLYKDGLSPVAELDGAGNLVTLFVYGSRLTVPAYMVRGGVTYRLFTDHLGSVRLVVNTTDGSIAQRIDYDAFGRVILDTSPGFQPFGFAGGLYDSQTGLIRFGARDYDPETGRWTSKDPAGFGGGDTNLYGYVVNDPVNSFDPNGLYSWEALLQDAGNVSAGFADTITLGGTKKIRQWMGTDNTIDQCSGAFKAGRVGGAVWQAAAAAEVGGALLGKAFGSGGKLVEGTASSEYVPGEYLAAKAPEQVTPGVRVLEGQYVNDLGRIEPWTAHYDEYGRFIARTDYNAGNLAEGIPDVHYHTAEWGPGKTRAPTGDHIPGEYKP
jgi:RHS repeat-associated protein